MRIEQLYPFPVPRDTKRCSRKYPNAREVVWCQEEPQNQGAWYQIRHRLQDAGRASASCCTRAARRPPRRPRASRKIHEAEQRGLVEAALTATNKEDGARETKRLTATPAAAAAATSR